MVYHKQRLVLATLLAFVICILDTRQVARADWSLDHPIPFPSPFSFLPQRVIVNMGPFHDDPDLNRPALPPGVYPYPSEFCEEIEFMFAHPHPSLTLPFAVGNSPQSQFYIYCVSSLALGACLAQRVGGKEIGPKRAQLLYACVNVAGALAEIA